MFNISKEDEYHSFFDVGAKVIDRPEGQNQVMVDDLIIICI
jgi:hypothetical protein